MFSQATKPVTELQSQPAILNVYLILYFQFLFLFSLSFFFLIFSFQFNSSSGTFDFALFVFCLIFSIKLCFSWVSQSIPTRRRAEKIVNLIKRCCTRPNTVSNVYPTRVVMFSQYTKRFFHRHIRHICSILNFWVYQFDLYWLTSNRHYTESTLYHFDNIVDFCFVCKCMNRLFFQLFMFLILFFNKFF